MANKYYPYSIWFTIKANTYRQNGLYVSHITMHDHWLP